MKCIEFATSLADGRRTVVPHPKKDLPLGTVKSIERQSGVKVR
ncbi:MAG: addiction module toxin, HicA family [Desulfurellales bacterium]|nr:MAG: addiction module toxin, HicA family [Desulfurellales bacterium]